jgi:hypothetical protein
MIPRSLRAGMLGLQLSVLIGCVRPDYAEHWPARLLLSGGPQPGFAIKRIIERQAPATLVGDDGSICRTSRERFERTREGRWVACNWHLPTLDSTQTAEPGAEPNTWQIAVLD